MAAGYYTSTIKKNQLKLYFSLGKGSFRDGDFHGDFLKVGIHPSYIISFDDISFELNNSLIHLDYYDTSGDLKIRGESQKTYLATNKTHYVGEFSLTAKYHFDDMNLYFQLGESFNYTVPDFQQGNNLFTTGISINLVKFKKDEY